MLKLLSLFFILLSLPVIAADAKLTADAGFFAISAKANGESSSISNPSAFRLGYLHAVAKKLELAVQYSILVADFSGSDLGYGLDVGANYYPFTNAHDENFKSERISATTYDLWKPYAGINFHQRNFQSVKNSYAGFGVAAGTERYLNEKMNLRGEVRYISLAGASASTATETNFFVGVVFKL